MTTNPPSPETDLPGTNRADDPIGLVRIEQHEGGHSVWLHTGGTPGNEWLCVWSTAGGNIGCTLPPEDVAGMRVARGVPGTPAAPVVDGDPKGAEIERLKRALAGHLFDGESLSFREELRSELISEGFKAAEEAKRLRAEIADLRASREAWAIEAMGLDVELASRPTADAYEKACEALELRRVALVKALGLPAATSFYDAVDQAASRPAIPADASAYQDLLGTIWLHVSWRSITRQLTTLQRELWADAVESSSDPDLKISADRWWRDDSPAPVSGSDATPPSMSELAKIVYCGSTEGYTGVDCQLEADHGRKPHEGRWIDPKNEGNWLFAQWPVSSGGDTTEVPGE